MNTPEPKSHGERIAAGFQNFLDHPEGHKVTRVIRNDDGTFTYREGTINGVE